MGNVFTTSPLPRASALAATPPRSLLEPPEKQSSLQGESDVQNPGTLEDLHKKCKDIFPVNFEGGRLMVNKGLSNHFQISHTLSMSSVTPSGYRFGATYVGTQQYNANEAFPVLQGDIDPSGNLNAHIFHQFTPRIRAKVAAQIQDSRYMGTQLTAEYRAPTYTTSTTLGNVDLLRGSGLVVTQHLQNVCSGIALGAELAFEYGPQIPGGKIAVFSMAGRYTGPDYIISGTLGMAGAHCCYYHKGSEAMQVGVEVETNFRVGESVASIGYQVDLPMANLVFRGMVGSNWTVGAVFEKKLQPLPFLSFIFSGMLDHAKNQSHFGWGLIISC